MKLKRVLSGVCIVSIMVVSILIPTYANDQKEASDQEWAERRAYLEKNMRELGAKGPDAVEAFFEENGIVKAEDSSTEITPQSAPGSVTLSNIGGYYDQYSGKYLVSGYWDWGNILYVDNNAGALDGVSLSMCQTNWNAVTGYVFSSNPAGIAVYDENGNYYDFSGNANTISKSGIAYTFQDAFSNGGFGGYIGYSGSVWFWLDSKPSQSQIYIKMDFQHTWSKASLSSFGISWPVSSAPTLSMSFSSTPSNFKIANQTTLSSWPRL